MCKATINLASLTLLLVFSCIDISNRAAYADDQPTQQHQIIYQVNYTPLKLGQIDGGQPLIPVSLDGNQASIFLVDTGTTFSIISSELAKQMNLYLEPGVGGGGKPILWKGKQAMTTRVPVLKVGNIRFTDVALLVLDAKDISLSPSGNDAAPYQGIIGSNLLQQFAVVLDSQKLTLGLCVPGNLSEHQVKLFGMSQPHVLPMTNVDTNKWFVSAQLLNGRLKGNENLLLDTGSDGTDVSEQLGQEIGLKTQRKRGSKNAYGTQSVAISTTDQINLGDLTLRHVSLTIRPVSEELPPTLGMDILSGYRVLMDFPAKKMYLQSNTAAVPAITVSPTPAAPAPPAK